MSSNCERFGLNEFSSSHLSTVKVGDNYDYNYFHHLFSDDYVLRTVLKLYIHSS